MDLVNGGNHPIQVVVGEVRSGGEAEAAVEEVGGNVAANDLGSVENRLQVHGFPDGARFDVVFLEGEAEMLAIATAPPRVVLPTSPMKILAGAQFQRRKPIRARGAAERGCLEKGSGESDYSPRGGGLC